MPIFFPGGRIRPWLPGDIAGLARLGDNRAVWRNLRDAFPHPYSKRDARAWIRAVTRQLPCRHFAIVLDGPAHPPPPAAPAAASDPARTAASAAAPNPAHAPPDAFPAPPDALVPPPAVPQGLAGGIGLNPQGDVHAGTAEIGYWLGEPFWGRGVMTAALAAFTEFAFAEFRLRRLYAYVLEWNPASMRVLEKCGYQAEGRLRKSAWKDGAAADEIVYARVL